MKIERSYIRLVILFILLVIFMIFYVVNSEQKNENIVESLSYSVNLMIENDLNEDVEDLEGSENIKQVEYHKYTGDLTGYSADCPQCNGTLACMPNYDVYKNGIVTYKDVDYGDVKIVASSKNIQCGSIIKYEDNYAIVLDRGVLGYDLDLLVESEDYARQYVGRSKITYEIIRSGW